MMVAALVLASLILVTGCRRPHERRLEKIADDCGAIIAVGPDGRLLLKRTEVTPESVDLVNRCLTDLGIENVRATRTFRELVGPRSVELSVKRDPMDDVAPVLRAAQGGDFITHSHSMPTVQQSRCAWDGVTPHCAYGWTRPRYECTSFCTLHPRLKDHIRHVPRSTWLGRFPSAFRTRRRPCPGSDAAVLHRTGTH